MTLSNIVSNDSLDDYNMSAVQSPNMVVFQSYAERQLAAAILIILFIITMIGNILVLLSVLLSKKLRTSTNAFVVNLSVADLLGGLSLALYSISVLSGYRSLSDSLCKLNAFISLLGFGCSVYTLPFIAFNRFILITKPTTYRWLYTSKKITVMLAVTWLVPFFVALLPIVSHFGEFGFDATYSVCTVTSSGRKIETIFIFVNLAMFYPFQLLIIFACYGLILRHIQNHGRKITACDSRGAATATVSTSTDSASRHRSRRENGLQKRLHKRQISVTKNSFYIVCAFFICITPFNVSRTCLNNTSGGIVYEFVFYSFILYVANSCLNPFFYARNPDFRKVFRCIICLKFADIPDKVSLCKY
ncbi:beta-1 adrenergic receptor-like [Amphiura filiformis]|uniref:beta-1 adrenergic receptor-like n=1 Tax=Amphiura filiformis TaxID=82378 RepID=UPI003B226184